MRSWASFDRNAWAKYICCVFSVLKPVDLSYDYLLQVFFNFLIFFATHQWALYNTLFCVQQPNCYWVVPPPPKY